MQWEDLSDNAKEIMLDLGNLLPKETPSDREVEGWVCGEFGETVTIGYSSHYLREMAAACLEVADWLDKRAESGND
jgi:hypothetical protein